MEQVSNFHSLPSFLKARKYVTATQANFIDDIGITEDNGPSGFSKTVSIFVSFFISKRFWYFRIAILTLPKYFKIIFSKIACDFQNIRK